MKDNAHVIKDYTLDDPRLDINRLYTEDYWDLIECNVNLDVDKLREWWEELNTKFKYLEFKFDTDHEKLDIEKSKQMVKDGFCGIYCGPISGYTLAWPIERDEPLPPPAQCNADKFPEVVYDTFMDDAKIMEKFKFGYLNELISLLGEDSFRQAIVTVHHSNMKILQHKDRKKPLKLHIPLISNPGAAFLFGQNEERRYHMKVGKVYILNTGDWHGTINPDSTRAHIITRIPEEHINFLLSLT